MVQILRLPIFQTIVYKKFFFLHGVTISSNSSIKRSEIVERFKLIINDLDYIDSLYNNHYLLVFLIGLLLFLAIIGSIIITQSFKVVSK